jgi:hypothetical protein
MQLVITPQGTARCIYGEAIDLHVLGNLTITHASHVEPDRYGRWIVDLSPVGGMTLGPFPRRSDALAAERGWLDENWLYSAQHIAKLRKRIDRQFHSPLHVAGVIFKLLRILHWRVRTRALLTIPAFLTLLIATQADRKLRKWLGNPPGLLDKG